MKMEDIASPSRRASTELAATWHLAWRPGSGHESCPGAHGEGTKHATSRARGRLSFDADLEHSALLLERVRPATHLPVGGDLVAIQVAVGLLSRLHQIPPAAFPFAARYREHNNRGDDGPAASGREPKGMQGPPRPVWPAW
jgi:hypothetical protein